MKNLKLIATDMDKTLLTDGDTLPPHFFELVQQLHEQGILFVVASGRPVYTLAKMFKPVLADIALIADNGGAIYYQGQIIDQTLIPDDQVQRLIQDTYDHDDLGVVCTLQEAIAQQACKPYAAYFRQFYYELSFREDLRTVTAPTNKYTLYFPKQDSLAQFQQHYGPTYSEQFSVAVSGTYWIDIMEKNVNKGQAISRLGKTLGITPAEMMAFGDNYNDLEMLQVVGHPVAMMNAVPELKTGAELIAPSNNDYGVSQVIQQYLTQQL